MKCTIATMLAISAFSFPVLAAPENYTLDPNHTNITWSANHFGFSNPSGKFTSVQGTLVLDEAKPENSKVNVTITLAGELSGVPKLDEHLKSDAFFDTAKFPSATFFSDKVVVTGQNTAKVYGSLTLHGVSKPLTLKIDSFQCQPNPMTHKEVCGADATATFDRSDYGVDYGKAYGFKMWVKLEIQVEGSPAG